MYSDLDMLNKRTALLVFSLSTQEEIKNKPFFKQKGLGEALHSQTIDIVKNVNLPTFVYDESKQHGSHFGAKFSNALQHLFDEGYDSIIAIGNDCPNLEKKHIIQAQQSLLNNQSVIGPTYDGGFYLLGLNKEKFDCLTFQNFSWNSEEIYQEVFHAISEETNETVVLQKLRDLDFYIDVQNLNKNFVSQIKNKVLRKVIESIATQFSFRCDYIERKTSLYINQIPFNKGSPAFLQAIAI